MIPGKLYFFSKSTIACVRLYFSKTSSTVCYMILKLTTILWGLFLNHEHSTYSSDKTFGFYYTSFVFKGKIELFFPLQLDSVINTSY